MPWTQSGLVRMFVWQPLGTFCGCFRSRACMCDSVLDVSRTMLVIARFNAAWDEGPPVRSSRSTIRKRSKLVKIFESEVDREREYIHASTIRVDRRVSIYETPARNYEFTLPLAARRRRRFPNPEADFLGDVRGEDWTQLLDLISTLHLLFTNAASYIAMYFQLTSCYVAQSRSSALSTLGTHQVSSPPSPSQALRPSSRFGISNISSMATPCRPSCCE